MSNSITKLAIRHGDLLKSAEDAPSTLPNAVHDELHQKYNSVISAARNPHIEQPNNAVSMPSHELLAKHSNMTMTVENMYNERKAVMGSAFASHFLNEINAASKINRGPEGFSNSSRLHLEVLLGVDETIDFCDYLNYDYDYRG
uniref:Uncharacterized protein n=1 Tax=Rhabditophanes sp. KR3021 TaxID=114890 RepID=A0AC35U4B7_9BILA